MCFTASPSTPKPPPPPPPPPRFLSEATREDRLKGAERFGQKGRGFRGTVSGTAAGVLDEATLVRENLVSA